MNRGGVTAHSKNAALMPARLTSAYGTAAVPPPEKKAAISTLAAANSRHSTITGLRSVSLPGVSTRMNSGSAAIISILRAASHSPRSVRDGLTTPALSRACAKIHAAAGRSANPIRSRECR